MWQTESYNKSIMANWQTMHCAMPFSGIQIRPSLSGMVTCQG